MARRKGRGTTPKVSEASLVDEARADLISLRYWLRMLVAVSHAEPDVWFGGSRDLHDAVFGGLVTQLVIGVRRLLDAGRGSGAAPEVDLGSLHACLARAGHREAADQILASDGFKALQEYGHKGIAHAKVSWLRGSASPLGVKPLHLSAVIYQASEAFVAFLGGTIDDLDPVSPERDAFGKLIRLKGVPGLDWPYTDVFLLPQAAERPACDATLADEKAR